MSTMTKKGQKKRAQRRAERQRLIAHLVLHDVFPVDVHRIAQRGGPVALLASDGSIITAPDHTLTEVRDVPWPPHTGLLRALANKIGVKS